jgi:uncharacterized surface protein with fasciclin (FAS1) repeats
MMLDRACRASDRGDRSVDTLSRLTPARAATGAAEGILRPCCAGGSTPPQPPNHSTTTMEAPMRKLLIGLAAAVGVTVAVPATASANHPEPDRTLADILLADSAKDDAEGFDRRWWDYDIVTQAVLLFPDLVEAASDPGADLTVFLPNDQAFRLLVKDITGDWVRNEADVFEAVASLGTDTVKNVLLYHIVPTSISYRDALRSDGATLGTLLDGASIEVDVKGRWFKRVKLIDADTDDRDAIVVWGNVGGAASNGYAHGISSVLRPIDLP